MWPLLLDYDREECKRLLRKLELEAYSTVVSAFRAQGELSKDKRKMLQDLSSTLNISVERHRAEIRRAVNDEELTTIAERLFNCTNSCEWATEGRRVVPLVPRLVPQTAFTTIANNVASAQAAKNPSTSTTIKEERPNLVLPVTATATPSSSTPPTPNSAATPPTNGVTTAAIPVPPAAALPETAAATPPLTAAVSSSSSSLSSTSSAEGVVISSAEEPALPPRKLFRSASMDASPTTTRPTISTLPSATKLPPSARTFSLPMGGTPVRLTLTHRPPSPATRSPATTPTGEIVLRTTCSLKPPMPGAPTVTRVITPTPVVTCASMVPIPKPKGLSQSAAVQLPSKAILQTQNPYQMKPIGVKIITQNLPGVSKLLPKSATGAVPPRVVSTRPPSPAALKVTLPPGATARPSTPGAGAKPNVIVVHKAQVWPSPVVVQSSASTMQEAMSLLHRGAPEIRQQPPPPSKLSVPSLEPQPPATTPQEQAQQQAKALANDPAGDKKSTLLADIIQATGISESDKKESGTSGSSGGSTPTEERAAPAATAKKKEVLEQLQEGQILELEGGTSTSDVLQFLQKAGLHIQQVMVPPASSSQPHSAQSTNATVPPPPHQQQPWTKVVVVNSGRKVPSTSGGSSGSLQELVEDVLAISKTGPGTADIPPPISGLEDRTQNATAPHKTDEAAIFEPQTLHVLEEVLKILTPEEGSGTKRKHPDEDCKWVDSAQGLLSRIMEQAPEKGSLLQTLRHKLQSGQFQSREHFYNELRAVAAQHSETLLAILDSQLNSFQAGLKRSKVS